MGYGKKWGKGGGNGAWVPNESDVLMAAAVFNAIGHDPFQGGGNGWDDWGGKKNGGWGGMGNALLGKGKGKGKSTGKSKGKSSTQKKAGAKAGDKKAVQAVLPWKSRLLQAWGKANKKAPTKQDLVWTSEEVEGEGWTSVLTCEQFSVDYKSDQTYETQTIAEASASQQALEGEYPEIYNEVPEKMRDEGALAITGAAAKRQPKQDSEEPKGEKRKKGAKKGPAHTNVPEHMNKDAKSRLNVSLLICAGRPLTTSEISYSTIEKSGKTLSTLTISCFDGDNTVFKGEAEGIGKEPKKAAECEAAELALEKYKEMIDEKTPEHEAKKAQKKIEREAKLADKKAAAVEGKEDKGKLGA